MDRLHAGARWRAVLPRCLAALLALAPLAAPLAAPLGAQALQDARATPAAVATRASWVGAYYLGVHGAHAAASATLVVERATDAGVVGTITLGGSTTSFEGTFDGDALRATIATDRGPAQLVLRRGDDGGLTGTLTARRTTLQIGGTRAI